MFIPIIFDISPDKEARYLAEFYRWLTVCKKYNWKLIATSEYFIPPEVYYKKGRREAYDPNWAVQGGYDIPKRSDFEKIDFYKIPDELIEELVQQTGSLSDASVAIFKERINSLENWLEQVVQICQADIEAFISFRECPSFQYVANKYNIKFIYYDMGAFRPPAYRHTAFLDLEGLIGNTSLEKRYQRFLEEIAYKKVPFLERRELLALFLEKDYLKYLKLLDSIGKYELGIAMQATVVYQFWASNFVNNLDALCVARKENLNPEDILIRPHPYDICGSKYDTFGWMQDKSETSLEFILKCKKILSTGSNVNFEAILWGRPTYAIANSPYVFMSSNRWVSEMEKELLNFICFGFYIPYELLGEQEYLRWRLKNPTEIEIYLYHFNHYMRDCFPSRIPEEADTVFHEIIKAKGALLIFDSVEKPALAYDELKWKKLDLDKLLWEHQYFKEKLKYYEQHVFSLEENIKISQQYIKSLEETIFSKEAYIKSLNRPIENKKRNFLASFIRRK